MALIAGLREVSGHVVRIRRALKILQMAAYAGRARQVVVVVDMAIGAQARRYGVRSRQCESGSRVIEFAVGPGYGVMTLLAGRGETAMRYRCGRRVEIILMAADASRAGDVVVVVYVAIRALTRRDHMCARQNEPGSRVIKLAVGPRYRVVTLLAGRREARVGHRSCRRVEIVLVATDAGCIGDVVVVVDMAIGALTRRNCMRSR